MGKWTDSNFESNQVMVVSCHAVSFKLIGQSVFESESGNQNTLDEHTPQTGKWRDSNFKSDQALVVSNYPVKFQVDRTNVFELQSGN